MTVQGNIVVTGVSSGIGWAMAHRFVRAGYRVFGSVRTEADGQRLSSGLGSGLVPLIMDVTDVESIGSAVHQVEKHLEGGGLDLLINNAGIVVPGPTALLSIDDYRKQFEVNLFGVIATTQAFLPLLGAGRSGPTPPGRIFNISSASGQLAAPFMGPYCASKHALEAFSHSLRRELLIYGIDVIIIGPGMIKTPIWDKASSIKPAFERSDYGEIIRRFRDGRLKASERGMEAETFADRLFQIAQIKRPRARYAVTNRWFTHWIIPRYLLSHRMFDRVIRRMFGVKKT